MAKLTRDQRLTRGGVLFFDVDGVLARTTKASKLTPEQVVKSLEIAGMGGIVASFIRDRVRDRWMTAQGPFKGHSTRWSVFVIPEFERKAGTGQRWWKSKRAQQNQIGKGLFSMSGGMWSGLQARSSSGGKAVIIDFRDTTVGQHGKKARQRTVKRGKRAGKVVNQRANPNVKNAEKAAIVLARTGVNVIQPDFGENMAMADAVSNRIGLRMAAMMDADTVQMRATSGAKTTLVRSLKRYWEV